jgi:hypothetical protein
MQARMLELESVQLATGGHKNLTDGICFMEAVAYVAGEPWSDHPACACPTLGTFMRNWNDSLSDADRQRLKPYIVRLVGTNDGNSDKRGWMCLDWLSRECAPAFLELAGLADEAASLRALKPILDAQSLKASQPALTKASKSADAAGDAARAAGDAAWDAARDARAAAARAAGAAAWDAWAAAWDAWAAAWDAAGDAAGDAAAKAAWDAAGDAARAAGDAARDAAARAAWAAAWDAARAAAARAAWAAAGDAAAKKALAPVVARLQESAFDLIERMLSLPKAA